MRGKKWLQATEPDEPVSRVAKYALKVRLQPVSELLKFAAKQPEELENVHQLRVATRRAQVALQLFDPLIPPRRTRWFRKRLKNVRSAAGTARDLDVLGDRIDQIERENHDTTLHDIRSYIGRRRKNSQRPILSAYRDIRREGYGQRIKAMVKRVRWRDSEVEPSFTQVACASLQALVDEFFELGQRDLSEIRSLHSLRKAGKRLRYAIELLSPAFDRSLRYELYPAFSDLQEQLGRINDHAVALTLFEGWRTQTDHARTTDLLGQLIVEERSALKESRQRFLQTWQTDQRQRIQQQFMHLLAQSNGDLVLN